MTNLFNRNITSCASVATVLVFITLIMPLFVQAQSSFQYDANGNLTNVTAAVSGPLMINEGPSNQYVIPGGNAAFSVNVSGSEPITFQWFYNGVPVQGATNSTLFFPSVTFSNQGSYAVVVCNGSGCVTSAVPALLEVVWTWVGSASDNWYDPTSWYPASVPASTNDIIIPSGATVNLNAPVTNSA